MIPRLRGRLKPRSLLKLRELKGLLKSIARKVILPLIGVIVIALTILMLVALVILMIIDNLFAVLGNYFLLRSMRRILYGLVTTYAAGPGAPTWVESQDNIIALKIPPNITTLSFNMTLEERQSLITKAREVTLQKLNKILSSEMGDVRFQAAN
jgi:hypothetical protein